MSDAAGAGSEMTQRFDRYADFWPHYLRAHSRPATRACHYLATMAALLLLVMAALTADWHLALAAPILGYAVAWVGHGAIEGNRPATFGHPLWSLASDLRMLALFVTGGLAAHLERHLTALNQRSE
jgi:hypothetical protein